MGEQVEIYVVWNHISTQDIIYDYIIVLRSMGIGIQMIK